MATYVLRKGVWYNREDAPPLIQTFGEAPMVISDNMDFTRHMADGKYYTSKAAFRAATKAAGCVEVGTDPAVTRPRKQIKLSREKRVQDIKRSIHELKNGRKR